MTLSLDKSAWKRVAFGGVIESITDRVNDPSAAGVDRYVGLEHLDPGVMTVQRWDTPDKVEAQKLRFQPGDVIFGRRRAYQKKVARAEFDGICSAHALVLRARPDFIDPDFLPVFLSSDYFLNRAISISVGSLSPTVNWRDLKVQEFDLPPLDEQKRIADLLWAVERHSSSLASLRKAGSQANTKFVEAFLSRTPGERVELGTVLDIVRGGSPRPISDYITEDEDGLSWIKIGDVPADGKYIDSTGQRIKPTGLSKTRTVQPGDFLLSNSMSFGRPYIVRIHGCIHDGWLALSDREERWRTDFLYELLRSEGVQAQFRASAGGSTVKNLNTEIVSKVRVTLPPLRDQDVLVERVDQFRSAEDALGAETSALTATKGSILSEVFGDS